MIENRSGEHDLMVSHASIGQSKKKAHVAIWEGVVPACSDGKIRDVGFLR